MDGLHGILQSANSVIVAVCQLLAMVVLSIGIVKALKIYLADVLTRFDFLRDNSLVGELVSWIEESRDEQGRFRPTSTWMAYKEWDFANKKEASPWITLLCSRILKRWYR